MSRAPLVPVGGASVMPMTETEVAAHVAAAWLRGEGGSILTVNVDILRAVTHDDALADLAAQAEIVVADGMPVVWATALSGHRVPERVTGASLVSTLAETAAEASRSLFIVGGEPGVPEAAAAALEEQFTGLKVVGTESPPFGFERDEQQVTELVRRVADAHPDLVLVGLGFPKQERLIARLRTALPRAWMLGCGAGIPFAAGQFRRAPVLVQRMGAEWLHRLVLEPRRLARRYLVRDLPFAVHLLTQALAERIRGTALPEGPDVGTGAVQPAIPLQRPAPRPGPVPAPVRKGA